MTILQAGGYHSRLIVLESESAHILLGDEMDNFGVTLLSSLGVVMDMGLRKPICMKSELVIP